MIKGDFVADSEVIQDLIFYFLPFVVFLEKFFNLILFVWSAINMSAEHAPKWLISIFSFILSSHWLFSDFLNWRDMIFVK